MPTNTKDLQVLYNVMKFDDLPTYTDVIGITFLRNTLIYFRERLPNQFSSRRHSQVFRAFISVLDHHERLDRFSDGEAPVHYGVDDSWTGSRWSHGTKAWSKLGRPAALVPRLCADLRGCLCWWPIQFLVDGKAYEHDLKRCGLRLLRDCFLRHEFYPLEFGLQVCQHFASEDRNHMLRYAFQKLGDDGIYFCGVPCI